MIDQNKNFRCDYCGKYISFDDIREGKALHTMLVPDNHFSSEQYETICRKCNVSK